MCRSNQLIQHYSAHHGAITNVAFHPSGNFLLSSSLDGALKIWDLREGQLFYTLHGHEGAIMSSCFSPAGDFFASAGSDEQVCAPDARAWVPLCDMLQQLPFTVLCVIGRDWCNKTSARWVPYSGDGFLEPFAAQCQAQGCAHELGPASR